MAMDMRGSLNVSEFQKSPDQPRFYGKALINGVSYKLKGWEKDGAKGPWISLLFEEEGAATAKPQQPTKPQLFSKPMPAAKAPPKHIGDQYDDDIPF